MKIAKDLEEMTPQQRWNAKNQEKIKQASQKQIREYKRFHVNLHRSRDRHLIDWLATQGSVQDAIYNCIQQAYVSDTQESD